MNILKDGEDPVLKEKSEYPEWLWAMGEAPTLAELQAKAGADMENFASLTLSEKKRFFRLWRRSEIRETNARGDGF